MQAAWESRMADERNSAEWGAPKPFRKWYTHPREAESTPTPMTGSRDAYGNPVQATSTGDAYSAPANPYGETAVSATSTRRSLLSKGNSSTASQSGSAYGKSKSTAGKSARLSPYGLLGLSLIHISEPTRH
eukprot:6454839-Karenia_brevis.AAC.1